ncbi:hypothetical protein B0H13DRAFT_1532673, partial [Mycena leptocephala]
MTDYASQGKSRDYNVVDLNNCRSHFSYYTCLSRSTTASGTAIVQGFNTKPITNGISGYLRQEFRDLELLNEITKARYDSTLPKSVRRSVRNELLRTYQDFKGKTYDPIDLHSALQWKNGDP